ncbi:MAG: RsmE family RNA methyltransferase [Planctomycetota bacterium]
MGIHRLYFPLLEGLATVAGDRVEVEGDEAKHLTVRRARPGEAVELLDGRGRRAAGVIAEIAKRGPVIVEVQEVAALEPIAPRVEIFAPTPKGDRLTQMLDQLSQLGAAAWTPLITEHTELPTKPLNRDRLARVCIEAMKQCGRLHLLEIGEPVEFADTLAEPVITRIAHPGDTGAALPQTDRLFVLIGPEGGFSDTEVAAARDAGIQPISLGPHICRIETAAVAAASQACTRR